jgi:thiamine-phosphate pyrophosphorylase
LSQSATLDFRLLFITDRTLSPAPLSSSVREACEAGVRAVQLREKDLPGGELFELATRLREETAPHGAALFVNDRLDIALAAGADGVHCPENGFPPDLAGRVIRSAAAKETKHVGASVHSPEGALRARGQGADFVTFGPVFFTPSKAAWGEPQGLDALEEVCRRVDLPVFAVGGVTAERAAACVERGAAGVAVISAIMTAPDVTGAIAAFESALGTL